MNFSRILYKNFSSMNSNKFGLISKHVKYDRPKLDTKPFEDKLRQVKTGPAKGDFMTLPTYPSKGWALSQGFDEAFKRAPVSAYYSMKVKDTNYHVFNAARLPLGRMAAKIAFIIQGKNSPHYRPNKVDLTTDKCIILNAKKTYLTGNKLEYKMYRHHSGYPGGLKEITAKHYLEKDCKEMLLRTIKGMIPKNKMRLLYLSKIKIYEEGGHDMYNLGLPQFGEVEKIDYNKIFGFGMDKNIVIKNSNIPPEQIDELFPHASHLKKELNEDYLKPDYMRRNKDPVRHGGILSKYQLWQKSFRRKHYKRIRKMAYQYI